MTDRATFEARAAEFLKALTQYVADDYAKRFPNLTPDSYSIERGAKYVRVVRSGSQRMVYCFLDYAGNVYKAESWKKPAKHIRGSIFDDNFSLGKSLTVYGAVYLK